jgi:hypothetical protein
MRIRRVVEATDSVHICEVREAGFWTKGVAAIRLDGFPVLIDWRTTPFGGSRAYFLCPKCSRRVEILYAAPHFACRRCHHLAYQSENRTPLWRKCVKLRKLQNKAGADTSRLPCQIPPKPKWQRWHTYLNLRRKTQAADHEFAAAYMRSRHGSMLRLR